MDLAGERADKSPDEGPNPGASTCVCRKHRDAEDRQQRLCPDLSRQDDGDGIDAHEGEPGKPELTGWRGERPARAKDCEPD